MVEAHRTECHTPRAALPVFFVSGDPLMRAPYPPHTVERCRMLVTTTLLPNEDIASQTDTSEATVRRWTRIFEWKRPEAVEPGRRRIPADKYPAVRRIYACGARSEDI